MSAGWHAEVAAKRCRSPRAPPCPCHPTPQVLSAVGLESLPLDVPLASLSDGYKR